jgi:DNA-binding NarL/FixJ family response regulator
LAVLELNPELLITDLAMPLMDGLQVAKALQKADCRAKIILLTLQRHHCVAGCGGLRPCHKARRDLETAVEEVLKGKSFRSDPPRRP